MEWKLYYYSFECVSGRANSDNNNNNINKWLEKIKYLDVSVCYSIVAKCNRIGWYNSVGKNINVVRKTKLRSVCIRQIVTIIKHNVNTIPFVQLNRKIRICVCVCVYGWSGVWCHKVIIRLPITESRKCSVRWELHFGRSTQKTRMLIFINIFQGTWISSSLPHATDQRSCTKNKCIESPAADREQKVFVAAWNRYSKTHTHNAHTKR